MMGIRRTLAGSRRFGVVLGVGLFASGCATDARLLENTHETPEALVEAALNAVEAQDGEALRALLVSREEFEDYVWPVLPDRHNTQLEFFWGTMAMNTRKAVRQLENNYGGLPIEIVALEMPGEEELESYEDFTFHVGVKVTVRRRDTGEEGVLPSFDGFLEYGGRWKLLNYGEL
ncbi:MAG: hypothetical protein ACPHWZ_05100 [Longimicrobiales bacterium]